MNPPIKPYRTKDLAHLYGVSIKTMITWLNPIREQLGKQIARMWSPKQVNMIFEHLNPPTINDNTAGTSK